MTTKGKVTFSHTVVEPLPQLKEQLQLFFLAAYHCSAGYCFFGYDNEEARAVLNLRNGRGPWIFYGHAAAVEAYRYMIFGQCVPNDQTDLDDAPVFLLVCKRNPYSPEKEKLVIVMGESADQDETAFMATSFEDAVAYYASLNLDEPPAQATTP